MWGAMARFSTARPPHDVLWYFYRLFIQECDRERQGFPWTHGQIIRESPAGPGEIPDRALALERASVVGGGALNRNATVGANGEGHRQSRREAYSRQGTIKPQGGG